MVLTLSNLACAANVHALSAVQRLVSMEKIRARRFLFWEELVFDTLRLWPYAHSNIIVEK